MFLQYFQQKLNYLSDIYDIHLKKRIFVLVYLNLLTIFLFRVYRIYLKTKERSTYNLKFTYNLTHFFYITTDKTL